MNIIVYAAFYDCVQPGKNHLKTLPSSTFIVSSYLHYKLVSRDTLVFNQGRDGKAAVPKCKAKVGVGGSEGGSTEAKQKGMGSVSLEPVQLVPKATSKHQRWGPETHSIARLDWRGC